MSLEEFRHVIRVNIEKNYQDTVLSLREEEVRTLSRIAGDKDSSIVYLRRNTEFLKKQLEEQRPGFWDSFEVGFIAGIVATAAVVFLTK